MQILKVFKLILTYFMFFFHKKSIKPTRKKFNFRKSESDVKNILKNQKNCYFPHFDSISIINSEFFVGVAFNF